MKPMNQFKLYAGGAGAMTLVAILASIHEQLITVGPWVLDTMLAAAGSALIYGGVRVYVSGRKHWLDLQSQKQQVIHEGKRQELELLGMQVKIYTEWTRLPADQNGNYPVMLPPAFISPAEIGGNVLMLPPGQIRGMRQPALAQRAESLAEDQGRVLPTNVRYEEIRHLVPRGHVLVGVGYEGVETKAEAVGACVWIVGLSGTGKTSTTVLRVEERKQDGHVFLGADPHFFKDDSLYHAIYETLDSRPGPYADRFALPMAKTPEEILAVLNAFHEEFKARKSGQRPKPWQKVTLLVDEVGSLMDKETASTPEEKEIIRILPSIARICGQEARNFLMGGMFISQQSTNLAWLRKVALMIVVHQLLQESEKRIATQNDTDVMEEMKYWPIGRTYVYGVGFQEGPRTVQQPYFKPVVEGTVAGLDEMEELQPKRHLWAMPPVERDTDELPEQNDELIRGIQAYLAGARTIDAFQAAMGLPTQHQARGLRERVKQAIEVQEGA